MCQRPGVRTDLHMFVVWATAGLLGATCGVDLDRPIFGEPTLVARSFCCYQLPVLWMILANHMPIGILTLNTFKVLYSYRDVAISARVTPRLRTWRYQLVPCHPLQEQTTETSVTPRLYTRQASWCRATSYRGRPPRIVTDGPRRLPLCSDLRPTRASVIVVVVAPRLWAPPQGSTRGKPVEAVPPPTGADHPCR